MEGTGAFGDLKTLLKDNWDNSKPKYSDSEKDNWDSCKPKHSDSEKDKDSDKLIARTQSPTHGDGEVDLTKVNIDILRQFIKEEVTHIRPERPVYNNLVDAVNYLAEIPTFSGNSSSLPIDEWLNKFNSISQCATWDDDRKLQILPSKLTNIAFDFYQQLLRTNPQTINTFDNLARQLKNRFNDPTTQETYLNRFHTAYKLPSESLRDFAQRLEKLFYKSFPRGQNAPDPQADYQLRIRFISGLEPRLQRYVRSSNSTTLQEALTIAIREQENDDLLHRQLEKASPINSIKLPMEDTVSSLLSQFATTINEQKEVFKEALRENKEYINAVADKMQMSKSNSSFRKNGNVTCFYCGKKGHFASVCREKNAADSNTAPKNFPQNERNGLFCDHCKKPGHDIYKCFKMSKILEDNMRNFKCSNCGRLGHNARNCRNRSN
jgi:hypothetical protein